MSGAELLRNAQQGDSSAWQELYARAFPLVWRYAWALCNDRSEAEEITSETLLALVRKLPELDPDSCNVEAWLRGVVRHKAVDVIRKACRQRSAIDQMAHQSNNSAEASPSDPIEHTERSRRVCEILDQLGEHERQALEWKYLDNLSVREIAERAGQTEKSAESILYRARREFRRLYDLAERQDAQPASLGMRVSE